MIHCVLSDRTAVDLTERAAGAARGWELQLTCGPTPTPSLSEAAPPRRLTAGEQDAQGMHIGLQCPLNEACSSRIADVVETRPLRLLRRASGL